MASHRPRPSALLAASCRLTALTPNSRFLSFHILPPFPVILNGGQAFLMGKTGNGIMTRSEESVTPNEVPPSIPLFAQGSWKPPPEEAAGTRSAIEDTRLP